MAPVEEAATISANFTYCIPFSNRSPAGSCGLLQMYKDILPTREYSPPGMIHSRAKDDEADHTLLIKVLAN
jgi:hypothetical protein